MAAESSVTGRIGEGRRVHGKRLAFIDFLDSDGSFLLQLIVLSGGHALLATGMLCTCTGTRVVSRTGQPSLRMSSWEELEPPPESPPPVVKPEIAAIRRARRAAARPLALLHIDDSCVCITKPAWMLVHGAACCPRERGLDAVSCLSAQVGAKVFPVHRLDRQTSGALLFARSEGAARELQLRWHQPGACKTYVVLVRGEPELDEWCCSAPLKDKLRDDHFGGRSTGRGGRHPRRKGTDASTDAPPGDEGASPSAPQHLAAADACGEGYLSAVTEFSVLMRMPQCRAALLLARLRTTGRTHQIRRHLNSARLHVLGDRTYGKSVANGVFRQSYGLRRTFLHAVTILLPGEIDGAVDGDGPPLLVSCPLPPELLAVLARLPDAPLSNGEVLETLGGFDGSPGGGVNVEGAPSHLCGDVSHLHGDESESESDGLVSGAESDASESESVIATAPGDS